MAEDLRITFEDAVAILTLDRPEQRFHPARTPFLGREHALLGPCCQVRVAVAAMRDCAFQRRFDGLATDGALPAHCAVTSAGPVC